MMVQSYNSSTGETKAGRSTVQGQLEKIARHCLRGAKKKKGKKEMENIIHIIENICKPCVL
jgi:hypothetical protein